MSEINPYGECKDCRFFVKRKCRKTHPTGYGMGAEKWSTPDPFDGCGEWEKLTERQTAKEVSVDE